MLRINQYSDIPGWGDFDRVYKELTSSFKDNCDILEIGVGFGRSTWAMLDAMDNNMTLHVIDNFKLDTTVLWDNFIAVGSAISLNKKDVSRFENMTKENSQQDIFSYIISQHPRFSQIKEIYPMSSQEYISLNKKHKFDLVFLDGDHSYEIVKQELEYFKDSTLLAGHDYGSHEPGVVKAVDEFIFTHKNRKLKIYNENEIFVIY